MSQWLSGVTKLNVLSIFFLNDKSNLFINYSLISPMSTTGLESATSIREGNTEYCWTRSHLVKILGFN